LIYNQNLKNGFTDSKNLHLLKSAKHQLKTITNIVFNSIYKHYKYVRILTTPEKFSGLNAIYILVNNDTYDKFNEFLYSYRGLCFWYNTINKVIYGIYNGVEFRFFLNLLILIHQDSFKLNLKQDDISNEDYFIQVLQNTLLKIIETIVYKVS
jgi:hypothetical protein